MGQTPWGAWPLASALYSGAEQIEAAPYLPVPAPNPRLRFQGIGIIICVPPGFRD